LRLKWRWVEVGGGEGEGQYECTEAGGTWVGSRYRYEYHVIVLR
jgi:hypothetical protein